jgi:hypothetical protein
LLLAAGVLMFAGCSGFNRQWDDAQGLDSTGLSGRWTGTWTSESTGHQGRLRCIVTPRGGEAYDARFHAIYCGIIPFESSVRLTAVERGGMWRFRGEKDLGWVAGGAYTYEGEADSEKFMARYVSAKDRGAFEMTRPR